MALHIINCPSSQAIDPDSYVDPHSTPVSESLYQAPFFISPGQLDVGIAASLMTCT